jgi:hypothetical protein
MPSQNRFDGQCCWRSGCCVWRGVRPNPCYIIAGSFQPLIQAWLSCARRVAVAAGNFKPLKAWLSQKIHSKGSLYPSGDALLVQLTGSPLKVRACVHASGGGGCTDAAGATRMGAGQCAASRCCMAPLAVGASCLVGLQPACLLAAVPAKRSQLDAPAMLPASSQRRQPCPTA